MIKKYKLGALDVVLVSFEAFQTSVRLLIYFRPHNLFTNRCVKPHLANPCTRSGVMRSCLRHTSWPFFRAFSVGGRAQICMLVILVSYGDRFVSTLHDESAGMSSEYVQDVCLWKEAPVTALWNSQHVLRKSQQRGLCFAVAR